MLFAGVAVIGGTLALGMQRYRARQPKNNLVVTLRPGAVEDAIVTEVMPRAVTSRTVAVGGVVVGGSLFLLANAIGLTPLVLVNGVVTTLRTSRYGPLLYIAADTVRPLTFFPDTLMTVSGGLLFGPLWGSVYSIIGDTTAAMLAYTVGKYARGGAQQNMRREPKGHEQLIERYGQRMQDRPFESMVLMRGLFLHFDSVSFLAGYLRLDWKPFLLGTVVGTLPGTVACVLFGASLEGTKIQGGPRLNPVMLAASGVMMVGSLGVAHILRKRDVNPEELAISVQADAKAGGDTELYLNHPRPQPAH